MAESVDALVSNTSGAIRAGSIPAPGTANPRRVRSTRVFLFSFPKSLIFKNLRFFFWILYHICTTRNSQIAGLLPGIECIFIGKRSWSPTFCGGPGAFSAVFAPGLLRIGEGGQFVPLTETRYRISELKQNVYFCCRMQSR